MRTMGNLPLTRGRLCYLLQDECAPSPPQASGLARQKLARPEHPVAEILAGRAGSETSRTAHLPSLVITDTMSTIHHPCLAPRGRGPPTEIGGWRTLCLLTSWTRWARPVIATVLPTVHLTRLIAPSLPRPPLRDGALLTSRPRKTFVSRKKTCPRWLTTTCVRDAVVCMGGDVETEGPS